MHFLWQDLRYGMRGLRNEPSFATIAILTLALGIGAATTMFSVIENVLLDPFPYKDADRIVALSIHDMKDSGQGGRGALKIAEYLDFESQNHVFSGVIGGGNEDVLYTTPDGTELFDGAYVTANTFDFLGVAPAIGRGIGPEDAKPGAPPVFVMSYKLWLRRFNLNPAILGRTFVLNGTKSTLVGIMPSRFTKRGAELWRPLVMDRGDDTRWVLLQARLKPRVTMATAQKDLDVIAHRVAQEFPKNYPDKFTAYLESYVDNVVGPFRKTLYTLGGAVALLLLIACANVANMLLAKSTAREREMAIRSAMGASRGRLVRQLLIESLLLAIGGAAAGCLLAYAGTKAITAVIPDGAIPREAVIGLNLPVLLFSLCTASGTALLFGLAPAVKAARRDIVEPLKDSGKGVSGGFRHCRLRNVLVVVEVALSLVLLAGAGLLIRSFVALRYVDLGFNPERILVARLPLPPGQYKTAADKQRFFRQLLERLQALPGVVAVTETTSLPPYGGYQTEIDIAGKSHAEKWHSIVQLVSEGYFPTLGLRLQRGRLLTGAEVNDARKIVVVNQTLVTKYFGKEDPIGKGIRLKGFDRSEGKSADVLFEIAGVVSDAKNQGIQEAPMPEMFVPYTVSGGFERGLLVRTAKDPMPLLPSLQREVWAVDRNVAITMTGSLMEFLERFSYADPKFSPLVLGIFAGVGLILVVTGVYSVIAYTVSRQTQEIGVRMALGAGRSTPSIGREFGLQRGVGAKAIC